MKRLFSYILALAFSSTLVTAQQTVGLFDNDSLAQNGYSLFTVSNNSYLIDNCGNEINSWSHEQSRGLSSYLTEEGTFMFCGRSESVAFPGGGAAGYLAEYDWEGNLLWSHDLASDQHQQHHDFEILPNGNIIAIVWELKDALTSIQNGSSTSITYWPDYLIEFEKVGSDEISIVWEWHAWDHLIQAFDPLKENFGVISEHPELIDINAYPPTNPSLGDWMHLNSIDYNYERDELLISVHHFNEIWIIDHSTTSAEAASHSGGQYDKGGDLLYRWGNPEAYQRGTTDDHRLFFQHDAKWIPSGYPNEGAISIFNNGVGQPQGNYASIVVINPPLDNEGEYLLEGLNSYGPEDVSWLFTNDPPENLYTGHQGGTQALPNGNFLINSTEQGWVIEATPQGEIVWDYRIPISFNAPMNQGDFWSALNGTAFRCERYLPDFVGFDDVDIQVGEPIELNPLPSDCIIYESVPTFSINPSEELNFDMLYQYDIKLLTIINTSLQNIDLNVFDLSGRKISSQIISSGRHEISLQHLVQGMYLVHVTDIMNRTSVSQKLIIQN
jgi:hypothetical protein